VLTMRRPTITACAAATLSVTLTACAASPAVHPRAAEQLRRGYAHLAAGDAERAEVAFAHALEFAPDLAEGWNGLGVVARTRQDLGAARRHFGRAVRLAPELAEAHANLGEALLAEAQREGARPGGAPCAEAVEELRAALTLAPDLPGARLNLARALLHQGLLDAAARPARWAEARREYLHLLEAHPAAAEPHADLAFMDYLSGRAERAEAGWRRAVELAPSPTAWHGLCLALARLDRCAEARDACDRCLALAPDLAACRASRQGAAACSQ